MRVAIGQKWLPTDKDIHFTHNFTDIRAAYDVTVNGGEKISNNSIAASESDWKIGQHHIKNFTDPEKDKDEQLLTWIMSPKGLGEHDFGKENYVDFVGHRCVGSCTEDIKEVETE